MTNAAIDKLAEVLWQAACENSNNLMRKLGRATHPCEPWHKMREQTKDLWRNIARAGLKAMGK